MSTSELITVHHLRRKAIIYIRQSTPHQVISHQESRRLQYALKERAISLGWRSADIEIIDADLGLTATSAHHRQGFKDLLSRVTLGEVGIIFSCEVTRLSRNCTDWYPLLDVCGYKGCLIADGDGIYDPGTPNGRLLLGLKGQLSEFELHTIRTRLTSGLLNKAERGDLALSLPVGLVRDPQGIAHKDPNVEVQKRLELVFSTFLRLRSAGKVVRYFNEQGLTIPRRNQFADLIWKKPTVSAILSTLKNPAYAGAFVYGRSRSQGRDPSRGKSVQKIMPMDQWRIVVKDKYPAYISWETFEQIQAMLRDNYAEYDRNKSRGVPREGSALLHGIVYCGECGHKMVVQYKGATRYICNALRQRYQVPVCQYIPSDPVDQKVVQAFFEALCPVELDAYAEAIEKQRQIENQANEAQHQQLQRLRYEAALAQRQFNQVDPDNRLVAAELERRWENALRDLKQAEQAFEVRKRERILPDLEPELRESFKAVGARLPQIWDAGVVSTANKKALLRCLMDKVVVHRQGRDQLHTRIVWKGGTTSTFLIPIPVGSLADLCGVEEMERLIVEMASRGISDEAIAEELTHQGYRSPMKTHVLESTVQGIRLKHRIFHKAHQSHPRRIPGWLTVSQIAQRVGVSKSWIYDRIHNGTIRIDRDARYGIYLFPDQPDTLDQILKLKGGRSNSVPI